MNANRSVMVSRFVMQWFVIMLAGWLMRGTAWADPVSWYVVTNDVASSDGESWETAFTNVQDALDSVTPGVTNTVHLAGHTFDLTNALNWVDQTNVIIRGGYEGSGEPGAHDLEQWPTVIRRDAAHGNFRVMSISNVIGGRLEHLTIADGNTPAVNARPAPGSGAGLRIIDSSLDIVDCVMSNNQANATSNGYVWGGGVYSVNSMVTILRTLFTGNLARNGSGANNARAYGGALAVDGGTVNVLDSEFLTNYADAHGYHGSYGGAIYMESAVGLVSNTVMIANQSGPNASRGGIYRGRGGALYIRAGMTVIDCTIVSNVIRNNRDTDGGGGVYMDGGLLRNSLVADNNADWHGGGIFVAGGIIESVTVAGNRISEAGKVAGVFISGANPIVSNSVFAANIREFDDVDVSVSDTGGTLAYSLTVPGRTGTGNIDGDPGFADPEAGNYRLLPSSPAIDAAFETPWMTGAFDLDGNARIRGDGPDMGCFEAPGPGEGPLSIGFTADTISGFDSLQVVFTAAVNGTNTSGLTYQWDFDNNGTFDDEGSDLRVVTNTYTPGIWSVRLRVTNELDEEDVLIRADYITVFSSEIYVSPDGDGNDGLSWETAFTNIPAALAFAAYSNTIYLAGKTFPVQQTINWAGHQDVRIQGGYEADPATVGPGPRDSTQWPTIIARDPAGGSFRPLYVWGLIDCVIEQVTITGGHTPSGGETPVGSGSGGGMWIESSVLDIVDCVFSNNQGNASVNGHGWGGAVYSANSTVAIRGTRFVNNRAHNGSGSNSGRTLGGALAAREGTLTVLNCEFIGNDSDAYGHQGSWGSAIYTESVTGWMRNILVVGNRAGPNRARGLGGGIFLNNDMVLENATVVSNQVWNDFSYNPHTGHAGTTAGGVYALGGAITNSIVWNNENREASSISDVYASDLNRFAYTCASDLIHGENHNITVDPMFVDPDAGDYRLQHGSPAIDTGINQPWMIEAVDLDGAPRILMGTVDMGCYETVPPHGSLIMVR